MTVIEALEALRDEAKKEEIKDFYSRKIAVIKEEEVYVNSLVSRYINIKSSITELELTADNAFKALSESSLNGAISSVIGKIGGKK